MNIPLIDAVNTYSSTFFHLLSYGRKFGVCHFYGVNLMKLLAFYIDKNVTKI
ncbi:hypothetical protein VV1062A_04456 [Vibrio vulnificus]|nr:hypothetical protein VV1062A_04456 [Vibrio vulnificus]OJI57506.1 hypothetical protein VFL11327_02682 [Vibrio fluvialis]